MLSQRRNSVLNVDQNAIMQQDVASILQIDFIHNYHQHFLN